ncbi:hypothetical protein FO519_002411, partial [Halicephalobus sp. NKZ332]
MTDSKSSETIYKPRLLRRANSERIIPRRISRSLGITNAPPRNVHGGDWKDMHTMIPRVSFGDINLNTTKDSSTLSLDRKRAPTTNSEDQRYWIEETFKKRECCEFIASSRDPDKCGCGRWRNQHNAVALQVYNDH